MSPELSPNDFLAKIQSHRLRQLLEDLSRRQQLGEEGLQQEIQRLTQLIAARLQPLLTQDYPAVPDGLCDSEGFNLLLEGLAGDLEVAALECLHQEALLQRFHRLYQDKIIQELRNACNRLEEDLARLETLSANPLGFQQGFSCTFAQASNATSPSHPLQPLLFRDFRNDRRLNASQLAVVDSRGRTLTLPLLTHRTVSPREVKLADYRLGHRLGKPRILGDLQNLLDQQSDTFWLLQVEATQPTPTGLEVDLEISLPSQGRFTILELQPVSTHPVTLSRFQARSITGQVVDLLADLQTRLDLQSLSQPCRFYTPQQSTHFFLTLTQRNYERLVTSQSGETVREIYRYTLGLDNILLGEAGYQPMGIYVSPVLEVENCVLIGLETEEQLPAASTALEYYIVKRDLDGQGRVLRTRLVPILPLSQRRVTQEALVFRTSTGGSLPDTATPRFMPHWQGELLQTELYENERPLEGEEYVWLDSLSGPQPSRLHLRRPDPDCFYWLTYQPAHLYTMTPYYPDGQTGLWYAGSNALHCDPDPLVARSQLWLVILLRRSPVTPYLTPRLNAYHLLIAQVPGD